MKLKELGFDSWFEKKLGDIPIKDCSIARVSAVEKDSCSVLGEFGEVIASILGKLRYTAESKEDFPAVGDWVFVQYVDNNTQGVIHGILPRRSVLKRKKPGQKSEYQLISSNIDTAFIMQSLTEDFNIRRLERYLIAVTEGGIEPVILLSKCDLISNKEIDNKIQSISDYNKYKIISFSNKTGDGIGNIADVIKPEKTYCIVGSSGVGKTTLLNKLIGEDRFKTGEIRESDGKGRHITSRKEFVVLQNGGLIIDTPGLREFGNIEADAGLINTFPDIIEHASDCKYVDCTHSNEPGCAVVKAIAEGKISESRFKSYLKLKKESDYNKLTYLEKRRKDKKFGKFVKKALKHHWKRRG
ncbi:ribosome small subunit-dependent GTPase A [Elusimicrobiota bacterium]